MTYNRKEQIGGATLYLGGCLDILPTLESADAVITDPPYGKVRGDFDQKWPNRRQMLSSVDDWLDAMVPRIKFNGSLWFFAWPSLAGLIEARIHKRLNVLAHVVWQKPTPFANKTRRGVLRAPMPETERIIFAEHFNSDNQALGGSGYARKCDEARGHIFEPLRKYLADEWARAGLTNKDANEATGTQMAGHWFTTTQWALPTPENYKKLQARANQDTHGKYLKREYNSLKREYNSLKREYKALRRYFDCQHGDQHTDLWRFDPAKTRHGHPTEKPVALMQYLVKLSVRPGGLVIDPFMGSGTTGVACANLGRKFIGIEIEEKYFDIACERIAAAYAQGRLFE